MRFLALAALLSSMMVAQPQADRGQPGPWKRYVTTPKGAWFDSPAPQPLAHFTRYPALLDMSGDFCYLCSPEKKLSTAKATKEPKAEVHEVGSIGGWTIYDVFYRFQSEGAIDWKSILVRTGPDEYREIYHDEPAEGKPNPSFLIKIGEETVVGVRDNAYRMDLLEEYWCFDAGAPLQLSFKPVWKAARSAIPADSLIIENPNGPGNFPNLAISAPVLAPRGAPCCEILGAVRVAFTMERCAISVSGVEFRPGAGRP